MSEKDVSNGDNIAEAARARAAQRKSGDRKKSGAPVGEHAKETTRGLRDQVTELHRELEEKNRLLEINEEGQIVAELDPNEVEHLDLANRIPLAYEDDEFRDLVSDISVKGRNIVPGKVRLKDGVYQVVHGHRRHMACQEAGTPFIAVVDTEISDRGLISERVSENKNRKDLSYYEEALCFRDWVDKGVFKNMSELSTAMGISRSYVSQRTVILDIPDEAIKALGDPRLVSLRQWRKLSSSVNEDRDALINRAEAVNATKGDQRYNLTTEDEIAEVIKQLVSDDSRKPTENAQSDEHTTQTGQKVFSTRQDRGRLQINLNRSLPDEVQQGAVKVLKDYFDQVSRNGQ